jgi:hypothetical protein
MDRKLQITAASSEDEMRAAVKRAERSGMRTLVSKINN